MQEAQKAGGSEERVLLLQMPRADLALPVLTISMCAPRVNATRTVGQGLSMTELEKPLLARYSLELHLIYYHTCKHLFANRFMESVLQSAGERSSESCHKLALAKTPLC